MKEKTDNIDILEEPKDILFKIDMQLYDEFNDKFCEINENLGTIYSYKDLEDLKKAESDTERTLLRQAISNLIAENKELKEEKKNMLETYKKINPEKMKVLADSFNEKVMSKLESDYISKSVIEKKIEELEDIKIKTQRLYPHTYTAIGEWLEAHYKINILQEILDERNNTDER